MLSLRDLEMLPNWLKEPVSCPVPKWRNWQTRVVQVHVLARVWGFESLLRHQSFLSRFGYPGTGIPRPMALLDRARTPGYLGRLSPEAVAEVCRQAKPVSTDIGQRTANGVRPEKNSVAALEMIVLHTVSDAPAGQPTRNPDSIRCAFRARPSSTRELNLARKKRVG